MISCCVESGLLLVLVYDIGLTICMRFVATCTLRSLHPIVCDCL